MTVMKRRYIDPDGTPHTIEVERAADHYDILLDGEIHSTANTTHEYIDKCVGLAREFRYKKED